VKTLVFFHAHPDDEAISTGGSMARASDEGHRVVLVVATHGDHGELPDDLGPDETLVDRRRVETMRSAEVLGVRRVVWLGYTDSGMTGWEQNTAPGAFAAAPVDEAAGKLAAVLREEAADVLTIYDWHGNYGHPDHIKVHDVGVAAAALAGTPAVFEATMNRDAFARMITAAREAGAMSGIDAPDDFDPNGPADDGNPFGMPEADLTHAVDVTAWVERKRASIACHRSQVTDSSFFLEMPHEQFAAAFGTEWYIKHGDPPGVRGAWLLE
jgi:LmbE family N-acetylglucosaminyl deacetylase